MGWSTVEVLSTGDEYCEVLSPNHNDGGSQSDWDQDCHGSHWSLNMMVVVKVIRTNSIRAQLLLSTSSGVP